MSPGVTTTAPSTTARRNCGDIPAVTGRGKARSEQILRVGGHVVQRDTVDHLGVSPVDRSVEPAAQARGARGDGVEHGLDIRRRARNYPQNFTGCRLLFEGDAEVDVARLHLLEQADVLDGDDGLGGKGLDERNFPIGERLDLRSDEPDDPIGCPSRSMGTPRKLRIATAARLAARTAVA